MGKVTLSVCMIVRDGEGRIRNCLESVKEIADEIIVVDTGSEDRTVEVAKSLGAKVVHAKWEDDFSQARNISLQHATKDWILVIDEDEKLEREAAQAIKEIIGEKNPYQGYYLRLVNVIEGIEVSNSIVLRLFKNHPDNRFSNKLHEQIVRCLQKRYGDECIGQTDIRMLHFGYDGNVSDIKKKYERNIALLLSYKEEEKDGYYYYVLGNEHMRMEKLEEALAAYKQALVETDYMRYKYVYFPYLVMNIAKVYGSLEAYQEMIQHVKEYLRIMPCFRDLYFMLVVAYVECKKFTEAKQALQAYRSCPSGEYEYPINQFDQMNNLDDLAQQLVVNALKREEMLLDMYIWSGEDRIDQTEQIIETMKSINEITHQAYVVSRKGVQLNRKKIENYGGIFLEEIDKLEHIDFSRSNGAFVGYLKAGEYPPFASSEELLDVLEQVETDALTLEIQDNEGEYSSTELRIFRRKDEYITLEEYQKATDESVLEAEDLGIRIIKK